MNAPTGPTRTVARAISTDTHAPAPLDGAGAADRPVPRPSAGRYQVVRLHATGGLGEVHVAEDVELNRPVALKRMRSLVVTDPDQFRRFLREAEITARLQHPGIVPVYGMAQDPDGGPAYAMRLIEGESLADAMSRFHESAKFDGVQFRMLLQHFVVVCQAVAYAHSRGVVHRDLKPANIMLGQFGETYIVDWGLARVIERDEAERINGGATVRPAVDVNGEQTLMGSAIGTPAYMSPEQAAGRWDVLGPAVDVYGLGAMLYSILTGRPPIANDTWPAMQQKIQRGDYPPPRQVNSAVPRALEAVCRKAMEFEPDARYTSAQELAADVQRWLADEPVAADREPWRERVRRWGRRHRLLIAGLVAATFAGLVVAAVAAGLLARSNQQLSDANRETRQAVDEFFTEVSENPRLLKKEPGTQELRKALLQRAREYYDRFLARWGNDPSVRAETGAACHRLASVLNELAPGPQAQEMYERARVIRAGLVAQAPADTVRLVDLAATENDLGALFAELGRPSEALALLESARSGREKVAAAHPDRPQSARDLAHTLSNIGYVHHALGHLPDGLQACRAAVSILDRLLREHPGDVDGGFELGRALTNAAWLERATGQPSAALATVAHARAVLEKLHARHAERPEFGLELAKTLNNEAIMLAGENRLEEARSGYEKARDIEERLARENPGVVEYLEAVASTHNNLAALLRSLRKLPESVTAFRRSLEIQDQLAREHADVPAYTLAVARACNNLGVVEREMGERNHAVADLERARALLEKLLRDRPRIVESAELSAMTLANLGQALRELDRRPDALAAYEAASSEPVSARWRGGRSLDRPQRG
jgi:eukaryotic-like serine/threonine-protein kinase